MTPKVSIIIPVYNVEPYVGECIESVMAQDAQIPLECIVVDDRGPDNSMTVVKQLVDAYQGPIEFRIVIRENNGGLSAARNSGIDVARGEYLYFLDSDDFLPHNSIRLLWDAVKSHPNVDVVVASLDRFPIDHSPSAPHKAYLDLSNKNLPVYSGDSSEIHSFFFRIPEVACNKLYNTRFFLNNNLHFKSGILHEDLHAYLRLYFCIQSIATVLATTYFYRLNDSSIVKTESAETKVKNLLDIMDDILLLPYKWDKDYIKQILLYVSDIRLLVDVNRLDKCYKSKLDNIIRKVTKKLPGKYRIVTAYLKCRHPIFQVRIFNKMVSAV